MSEMERLAGSVSELGMMLAATAALDAGEDRDAELRRLCGRIEDRLGENITRKYTHPIIISWHRSLMVGVLWGRWRSSATQGSRMSSCGKVL